MATEVKKAVDLGLLEEDDEFEEFPAESKCKILWPEQSLPRLIPY